MRFTVSLKLRPIKIAFFVRPNDSASLLRAIAINSFLWGGYLNPIIPLHKQIPRYWREKGLPTPPVKTVLEGYIDAFDPDFVSVIGCKTDDLPDVGNRKVVESSEILENVESTGIPRYEIGYYELAQYFGKEELRFVRKEPIDLVVPHLAQTFEPFLASVVGKLPQGVENDIRRQLMEGYKSPELKCDIRDFWKFFSGRYVTPRKLVSQFLEPEQFARPWERNSIIYLDASSVADVLDYWNLRALGFRVLPLPKQCSNDQMLIKKLQAFILESHEVHATNADITYDATILRARSVDEHEFKRFVKESRLLRLPRDSHARPGIRTVFPRFWDEWARERDRCRCIAKYNESTEFDVVAHEDRLHFKPLVPEFVDQIWFGSKVANEVALQTYSDGEPIAEVFPEASEELARAIGSIGPPFDDWRFSSRGLVHFPRWSSGSVTVRLPLSQRVFEQWFATKGWEVSISSEGRAARQLLKHFGGKHWISRLADEGVVKLLKQLSSKSRMALDAVRDRASEIAQRRGFGDARGIIANVIDSRLAHLGIAIRCPSCGRHPWYSLADIDYTVECTECLGKIEVPTYDPRQLKWVYRGTGPLISLGTASGAFSVLLTLHFFASLMDSQLTPAFGVEIARDDEKHEIDFGCFLQMFRFRSCRTEVVLAECKSYNPFEAEDAERLSALGAHYPGSVLVFSTLRRKLTIKEKRLLKRVTNRGRKYWKAERPFNPVLILTGNELFAAGSFPGCWRELGGEHERFANRMTDATDLLPLCDATQQLYLGMGPLVKSWGG